MDAISDELLARIWSPELAGGRFDQGPWIQNVKTSYSIQVVESVGVIEGRFVACVAQVDWTSGTPEITPHFVRVDMGTVAAAADEWRESM